MRVTALRKTQRVKSRGCEEMRKAWKITTLVTFILTIIILAVGAVFLYSDLMIYRLFNSIDKGNWSVTKEYYDALTPEQQKVVDAHISGYAHELCREYANGERSYTEVTASFDAINSLDNTDELYNTHITEINYFELKSSVEELYIANTTFDTDGAVKAKQRIEAVQKRMDTATKEQLLIQMLNDKYQEYLDCKIDQKKLTEFMVIVTEMSYYEAHSYAAVIGANVVCVEKYRSAYTEFENMLTEDRYFDVLDSYDKIYVGLDEKDTVYRGKFEELYQNAFYDGMDYYQTKLDNLIAASDGEAAVALMKEIELRYGSAFDLDSAKSELASDWQKTYIQIAMNYEAILQTEFSKSEEGVYIFENQYQRLRPDSMLLYDIDKNGVAELFLFNSKEATDENTECFVFTFANGSYVYLGYVNVLSLCTDSNIIALPGEFGRDFAEEHVLLHFTGTSFEQKKYTKKDGETYVVDNQEVTDVEFLTAQTSIVDHGNNQRPSGMNYVDISDYESYILAY